MKNIMEKKQKIAIILPLIILTTMLGVFHGLSFIFNKAILFDREIAWYVGFWIYWPIYCLIIPFLLLGKDDFKSIFQRKKQTISTLSLNIIPFLITIIGMIFILDNKEKSLMEIFIIIIYSFGNGFFEEILWRGLYAKLFEKKIILGYLWPTIWFSLWHIAPGTLSINFMVTLCIGALIYGVCWGWSAYKTKSIIYSGLSHTSTGLVQIFSF